MGDRTYTTRLQKGGALLDDMRQLLLVWDGQPGCVERLLQQNPLASPSRARLRDVIRRTFIPRFVRSQPPELWRPLEVLERHGWSLELLLPIHYYAAAWAEPLLWDFTTKVMVPRYERGLHEIDTGDVIRFIEESPAERFPRGRWTAEVTMRVARGLLAALRDLGLLSGVIKKTISPLYLPVPSFAFLAMARHQSGSKGRAVLTDSCWRLFSLTTDAVEHFFIEAQQLGLLQYHAAGSVIRIDYPVATLEEYAHVLIG